MVNRVNAAALICLYNPCLIRLQKVLDAIRWQGFNQIVLINDGSCSNDRIEDLISGYLKEDARMSQVKSTDNCGLNSSITVGASQISSYNTHVMLIDQDTILPHGYLHEITKISGGRFKGCLRNAYCGSHSITRAKKYEVKKAKAQVYSTKMCMLSGMLMHIEIFNEWIQCKPRLRTDYIDVWLCRYIRKTGGEIVIIPKLILDHKLGDHTVPVGYGTNKYYSFHHDYYRMSMRGRDLAIYVRDLSSEALIKALYFLVYEICKIGIGYSLYSVSSRKIKYVYLLGYFLKSTLIGLVLIQSDEKK